MKMRLGITLVVLTIAAVGCGDDDDDLIAPSLGDLEIFTVTTGDDLDANGYTVTIDGVNGPAIPANGSVTEQGLPAGPYLIGLAGVAANCSVQNNPRTVDVVGGQTVSTIFDVICSGVPVNDPPVADAGMDQTVVDEDDTGSEDVVLDGSGSTDGDGAIVTWSWSENDNPIATGDMPTVSFAVGAHLVTLTVTDDDGGKDMDDVVIVVEAAPAATVSFATDIQPYFEAGMAGCVACHSGGTGQAGVNLDSYANILTDGTTGPLVVPGNSADATAILIPQLNADHFDGPDDAGFVVTLSQWIDEGALDN